MPALARRVRRLETAPEATCPICLGKGKWVVNVIDDPIPENRSETRDTSGCPGCGKVLAITVRYVQETAITR